ncbi:tabinhibitin 3 [Drosophila tropicalis]|uniref:tabinhibitin 3 n=1 Tax=Drosophila tropicalis TaxID=46794 RepID=UPI0035AB88B0
MHLVHKITVYIVLIIMAGSWCLAIDFCRIESCHGVRHLGCHNSLTFHESCQLHRRMVNMQYFHEYLIRIQNRYRQDVASGAIQGLAPAQHMPELVWDSYLALLAEYHVKRCLKDLTNLCVATTDFDHPVLNYAVDWQPRQFKEISNVQLMTQLTERWLHQVFDIQTNDPDAAPAEIRNIINDYATYLGCAAGQDYDLRSSRFVLICYYSSGPEWGQELYRRGSFNVTHCSNGKSESYDNLCKTKPSNN